ncbi:hypothetical protein BYT27DRAFT_7279473 [Phlegmacium glaucopus]|nr:hypothetical protein BYT27DRAFT_7279473 [Phlegmacium glaucopus]
MTDGNLNVIQGSLHHMDRSTTITNTDSFNVEHESITTGQSSPATLTLTPTLLISHNSSAERHDADRLSNSSYHLPGTLGSREVVAAAVSVYRTADPSPLDVEPHLAPSHPRPIISSNSDERGSLSTVGTTTKKYAHGDTASKKNMFCKRIRDWIDRPYVQVGFVKRWRFRNNSTYKHKIRWVLV